MSLMNWLKKRSSDGTYNLDSPLKRRELDVEESPKGHAVLATVTPAIRVRQRPGHPGSPDVLSANGSLHFRRYSEACNGRVERFLCQCQIYFRSYYSGFF